MFPSWSIKYSSSSPFPSPSIYTFWYCLPSCKITLSSSSWPIMPEWSALWLSNFRTAGMPPLLKVSRIVYFYITSRCSTSSPKLVLNSTSLSYNFLNSYSITFTPSGSSISISTSSPSSISFSWRSGDFPGDVPKWWPPWCPSSSESSSSSIISANPATPPPFL